MIYYILYTLTIFIINFFIKKNKLLINKYQLNHQKFANTKIPLVGGYYLIIPVIFLFYNNYLIFSLVFFLIFLLGACSDLNILSSPKKRFFIQFIIILLFIFTNKIEVIPSRINYIDELFLNTYWSYLFSVFCLMILINGSNFIDGLNGLLLGYLFIILLVLHKLNLHSFINISNEQIYFLIYIFFIVLIFNILNQLFLGDSGAYFLSFFVGFILIEIYNANLKLSPYFIILLLWYPCFENLFSILRKLLKKKSVLKPDNYHLHQLIFKSLKNKYQLKNLSANIISGIMINTFNFILLYLASLNPYNTVIQLKLIITAVLSYIFIYILINKSFNKKILFRKK
jgi:UDP-N-acetylmuramyl pentapeptide phosphotransferase/UDP-N-acetylglucosamine-1-phosphate transferase